MNKNQTVVIPIFEDSDDFEEIKVNLTDTVAKVAQSTSPQTAKIFWNKFPKTLLVICLLEVTIMYGLLFLIDPSTAISQVPEVKTEFNEQINSEKLIALTNSTRQNYGLSKLNYNHKLTTAAQNKAEYILANDNFDHFSLTGETFSTWVKNSDYHYLRVGENLAINYNKSEDVISAWLASTSHRKNLLNPLYEEMGIATLHGTYKGKPTTVVVQIFGTPE